jgi:NAD(P)-dependent dehydrogenase (short-subunit alcohol dehydrogenase family)
VAEAAPLQPHRHLPVLPRGDPGDEAAAKRQDRQPLVDGRPGAGPELHGVRRRQDGRHQPDAVSRESSSAYATAKGGIIALTRKLAFELGPHGITVNAIAPSLTLSERIRPRWEQRPAEAQAAELKRVPLGRVATPEDQARVICFLASTDADFVTGVTIDVTGGQ